LASKHGGAPNSGFFFCSHSAELKTHLDNSNWLARSNESNHPNDHRRSPLRRSHHRGHRRRGYQDGRDGDLDGRITARGWLRRLSTTPSTTCEQECGSTWARTRRSTTLSCTPFIVLCSRYSKNPAARRLPSSQTLRQPYRGLHPTRQAQDSDTLSRSHNRHTAYGSNEVSPSNSGGSPAMQAPPATRRPTSGQRWQHGTNAAQSNCLTRP